MITLSFSRNGQSIYIRDTIGKRVISFPINSIAYFKNNEITIVSRIVQAIPSLKFNISDLDAANSNPSFSKETSADLSSGLTQFFALSKSWYTDIGISNGGGGSGGGSGSAFELSNDEILRFKAWLIKEFGDDIDVMQVYRNLVQDGTIRSIPILN